jgi:branched-chain amino acid aminotransferase
VSGGIIWVDGQLHDAADAHVSVSDHGVTVGDGVFETLKVVDGNAFALSRHLRRLRRSAEGLRLSRPSVPGRR